MGFTDVMGYYSATKKNEIMAYAVTRMNRYRDEAKEGLMATQNEAGGRLRGHRCAFLKGRYKIF